MIKEQQTRRIFLFVLFCFVWFFLPLKLLKRMDSNFLPIKISANNKTKGYYYPSENNKSVLAAALQIFEYHVDILIESH